MYLYVKHINSKQLSRYCLNTGNPDALAQNYQIHSMLIFVVILVTVHTVNL